MEASGNKAKEAAALLRLCNSSQQNEAEALKYAEMAEMKVGRLADATEFGRPGRRMT